MHQGFSIKTITNSVGCSFVYKCEEEDSLRYRHSLMRQVEHQSLMCPLRLITCRFCGDMVQAGAAAADARDRFRGLSEHESICGSRTAPCDSCGRSIMLKEMDLHVVAVHQKS